MSKEKLQRDTSLKYCEFAGDIYAIRAIEDCIRATHKYTERVGTMWKRHPVQGEDIPSRAFGKFYEVYPDIEINWNMPSGDAIDLLWGDAVCIGVRFNYDYRIGKASATVKGDADVLKALLVGIPDLIELLSPGMTRNGYQGSVEYALRGAQAVLKSRAVEKAGISSPPNKVWWEHIADILTPRSRR